MHLIDARDRYLKQQQKKAVRKEMNRVLSNARSVKKINHISAL